MHSPLHVELVGELAELGHALLVAVANRGLAAYGYLRPRRGALEPQHLAHVDVREQNSVIEVDHEIAVSVDAELPHRARVVLRDEDVVDVRRSVRLVAFVRLEHAGARRPACIGAAGKPQVVDHGLERAVVVARARDEVGVEVAHDDDRAVDVTGVRPEVHREVIDEQPFRPLGLHKRRLRRCRAVLPPCRRDAGQRSRGTSAERLRVVLARRVVRLVRGVGEVRLDHYHRLLGCASVDAADVATPAPAVVDAALHALVRLAERAEQHTTAPHVVRRLVRARRVVGQPDT